MTTMPIASGTGFSVRTCTTLGPAACVTARMLPKSRSCVNTTNEVSFAYRRITSSGAFGSPIVDQ